MHEFGLAALSSHEQSDEKGTMEHLERMEEASKSIITLLSDLESDILNMDVSLPAVGSGGDSEEVDLF